MSAHVTTVERPAASGTLSSAVAVVALALAGYLGAANLHIAAALGGGLLLLTWGAIAFQRPQFAIAASMPVLLVAGTKFRTRDATDSLAGVMDAQILLEIGLFTAIACGLFAIWLSGRFDRRRPTTVEALVVAYGALALLSTAWSLAPVLTLVRATQLLVVSGLAILAVRLAGPSRALWMASAALAVYVLACAASALVVAPESEGPYGDQFRLGWFAVHPIAAGTFAALAALGLAAAALFREGAARRIAGLPLPVIVLALVTVLLLTSARGPLLAFVAAAGVLLVVRMQWPLRLSFVVAATGAALIYFATGADFRAWLVEASQHDSTAARMFFRGQTADTVLALNGRLGLWDDLSPAIAANAILGHGYQASRAVVLESAPWASYAHNALLQSVLDLGLLGTLALCSVIAAGAIGLFASPISPRLRATAAALMIFLLVNSIATESFAGAPGFETFLLLLCVLAGARKPS